MWLTVPTVILAGEAGGTRFAFLGGRRLLGMRQLDPVFRPAVRPLALRPIGRLEDRLRAR